MKADLSPIIKGLYASIVNMRFIMYTLMYLSGLIINMQLGQCYETVTTKEKTPIRYIIMYRYFDLYGERLKRLAHFTSKGHENNDFNMGFVKFINNI